MVMTENAEQPSELNENTPFWIITPSALPKLREDLKKGVYIDVNFGCRTPEKAEEEKPAFAERLGIGVSDVLVMEIPTLESGKPFDTQDFLQVQCKTRNFLMALMRPKEARKVLKEGKEKKWW